MRSKKYNLITYYDKNSKKFRKKAVHSQAQNHLRQIITNHKLLSKLFKKYNNIHTVQCKQLSKNEIMFETAKWKNLEELIIHWKIWRKDAFNYCKEIIDKLPKNKNYSSNNTQNISIDTLVIKIFSNRVYGYLDLISNNIFIQSNGSDTHYYIIDQERYVEGWVPKKYLYYRVILDLYRRLKTTWKKMPIPYSQALSWAWINPFEKILFRIIERSFQRKVKHHN